MKQFNPRLAFLDTLRPSGKTTLLRHDPVTISTARKIAFPSQRRRQDTTSSSKTPGRALLWEGGHTEA